MICYSPSNGSPSDDRHSDQPSVSLSTTGFFQRVLDEIDLSHPSHALNATQTLRERVEAEEIFTRLVAQHPSPQVDKLFNAAAGLSANLKVPAELRKELIGLFIDTAGVCAERGLIEPQIRFGRVLHMISVTTMDAEIADQINRGIREKGILFDASLLKYSPSQFETQVKYRPGDHDFRGFTEGRGRLEYVDCLVSVAGPDQDIIETSAVYSCHIPDARAVVGYHIDITAPDGRSIGIELPTTDRHVVKEVHRLAVDLNRESGTKAALTFLRDVTERLQAA